MKIKIRNYTHNVLTIVVIFMTLTSIYFPILFPELRANISKEIYAVFSVIYYILAVILVIYTMGRISKHMNKK